MLRDKDKTVIPLSSLNVLLRTLWSHISPARRLQLAAIVALMAVSTLAELVSIGAVLPFLAALSTPEQLYANPLMAPLISALCLSSPPELLLPITVLFGLAALLSGATRLALLWAQTRLSFAIGADLGGEVYRRTLYQPYSVHVSRNSAEVLSAIMNKAGSLVFITILPVLNLVSAALILFGVLTLLLAVDPLVSIGTFAGFGGVYAGISGLTRKDLLRAGQRVTLEQNNVVKAIQEGLGGIRDVLIDGTQEIYIRTFLDSDGRLRHASANIAIIGGAPRYIVETIGMLLIGGVAYWVAARPGGVAAAIPVLGALALGAQRILPLLQQLYNSLTTLWGGKALLADVLDLLAQPMPGEGGGGAEGELIFREVVAFQNVSFRYGQQTPWVLKGINLEITRGQRIGIIGATGSGKSTLLDILMGLLPPTEGNLSIDGVIVDGARQRAWQRRIAHVPQSIYLADTTIAENIAFGIPAEDLDMERVKNAAANAQIADTIETWRESYQTRVGERGVRLSGGQRQRIGIARALYKNADLIILDEATSALDNETEQAVMSAIDSLAKGLTIVIVAHRLSTLRGCDQIVEIADGKVFRTGTFQQLITEGAGS